MIEGIKKRISSRTYIDKPIEEEDKKHISELLSSNRKGPFGSKVRFELLDFTEMDTKEIKTLGTYGIIKGAKLFIVGAVKRSDKSMEDYGYCLEKIILMATVLGFGTCWIGGTFKRSSFAKRINVSHDEVVPAISPIGYARGKGSTIDSVVRFIARSHKRKQWSELFFNDNIHTPLEKNEAGEYATSLEAVRIAPSASNKQPWRIVKEKEEHVFHFYLKGTRGYGKAFKGVQLQNIDMGIAMCHFELASNEMGLIGRWEDKKPPMDVGNMEYIVSWRE